MVFAAVPHARRYVAFVHGRQSASLHRGEFLDHGSQVIGRARHRTHDLVRIRRDDRIPRGALPSRTRHLRPLSGSSLFCSPRGIRADAGHLVRDPIEDDRVGDRHTFVEIRNR